MPKAKKYHPKDDPRFSIVYNRNRTRFQQGNADTFEGAVRNLKAIKVRRKNEPRGFYLEIWKRVAVRKGRDDV